MSGVTEQSHQPQPTSAAVSNFRMLVVCDTEACSTLVAQRVRHAAHAHGLDWTALAGTEQSLPIDLDSADIVLVGPHFQHDLARLQEGAEHRGATVVLLPADIFGDRDGSRTLSLVQDAVAAPPPPPSP